MTDTPRLLLTIALLTISLSAYFLVIGALFNNRVIKVKNIITQTPGRAFGLGLVNFFYFGFIIWALDSIGIWLRVMTDKVDGFGKGLLTIPALLILVFLTVLLSIGLTSMVHFLGERLAPESVALKRNLWSAVILCLACALPYVGWFLLLPSIGFVGIGAVILAYFQRETK